MSMNATPKVLVTQQLINVKCTVMILALRGLLGTIECVKSKSMACSINERTKTFDI